MWRDAHRRQALAQGWQRRPGDRHQLCDRHVPHSGRVQLENRIYVLHAFQKKSKTGKKTPKQDVELIKKRYKEAQELAKHAKETEKGH